MIERLKKPLTSAVRLVWSWAKCPHLKPQEKLVYLLRVAAYALNPVRNKSIRYLGSNFSFDNPKTPMILLRYPEEIAEDLLDRVGGADLESVLDIGGNIGQFSATLLHYHGNKIQTLDVFEPNCTVWEHLESNLGERSQVRLYRYGVGISGERSLFFSPGRSSTASLSSDWEGSDVELKISLTANVSGLTGRSAYDLVKIDVEGAEFEVLRSLDVKTRFLFVECSGKSKADYRTSELFELIEEKFGKFDLLVCKEWLPGEPFNILLEFYPTTGTDDR